MTYGFSSYRKKNFLSPSPLRGTVWKGTFVPKKPHNDEFIPDFL